jgi:glycosyltransferase involved in cell wall biosynthesis
LNPIKIVYLIRTFNTGGAEKLLLHWMQYINANASTNIACRLVIWQKDSVELSGKLPADQVKIFNIWHWSGIIGFYKLRKWLKQYNPDIIHSHLPASGLLSVILKVTGLTYCSIYTEHSLVNRAGFSFRLHGIVYHLHQSIHFVSNQVKKVVDEADFYHYKNFLLLPNAVPFQPFIRDTKNLEKERIVIGTLANFRKLKQLPQMVELMVQIEEVYPDTFDFCIGGDGPEYTNVLQAISVHKMPHKIKLCGRQQNTVDFLAGIDLFLLTSSTEGLPLTLIEALQQGCLPAIAFESGLQEVSVDAFGVRFSLDDPSDLLKFLSHLNKLPLPELKNLQQQTRNYFLKQYDFNQYFNALIHHYNHFLARN